MVIFNQLFKVFCSVSFVSGGTKPGSKEPEKIELKPDKSSDEEDVEVLDPNDPEYEKKYLKHNDIKLGKLFKYQKFKFEISGPISPRRLRFQTSHGVPYSY